MQSEELDRTIATTDGPLVGVDAGACIVEITANPGIDRG